MPHKTETDTYDILKRYLAAIVDLMQLRLRHNLIFDVKGYKDKGIFSYLPEWYDTYR